MWRPLLVAGVFWFFFGAGGGVVESFAWSAQHAWDCPLTLERKRESGRRPEGGREGERVSGSRRAERSTVRETERIEWARKRAREVHSLRLFRSSVFVALWWTLPLRCESHFWSPDTHLLSLLHAPCFTHTQRHTGARLTEERHSTDGWELLFSWSYRRLFSCF